MRTTWSASRRTSTSMGSLLEFMAIGTAVKRDAGMTTLTPTLPPQAIIKDKDTWVS